MFEKLLARLHLADPPETPMPPADAQHALGALLVRVAKADRAYLFAEIEEIDHMLSDLYDLNPVEAARMRAQCEKLEAAMPDTAALAHILDAGIGEADKESFVRGLWRVSAADGFRHESETQVVALATEALGLAPERARALRDPA
ncbi:MAG: hypothetical protein GVY31_07435 [Alphaproteobacteria bacterium]|jgi:uncharacterized tellurite resistance protein B-like protein|nr:hypothetical protein [Alphaproteobacteria bacterium]